MADKEQIMIDGVDVRKCESYNPLGNYNCSGCRKCEDNPNCYFKQLTRNMQKYNELALQIRETQEYSDTCAECKDDIFTNARTSYSQIEVESRALAKIISRLKSKTQKCKELLKENQQLRNSLSDSLMFKFTGQENETNRYRKAFEEIEKIAQNGLSPICYKSNCSCCRCYDGDDCNTSMTSLINNYFTENGEFVDGSGDFVEALEGLLESERKKCNKAQPIAQRILDIISGFADGRNEMSPDSEQIEHTVTEAQMRNSVSVEQIQDNKAKGEECN